MRQFTIAERLFAATLLPLVGMLAMPYLATVLVPFMDAGTAAYAQVFIAMVIASVAVAVGLAVSYSIARPLAVTADTIDAMANAELESVPALPPNRSGIAQLIAVTERLAEVLGERQRRELSTTISTAPGRLRAGSICPISRARLKWRPRAAFNPLSTALQLCSSKPVARELSVARAVSSNAARGAAV